MSELKQPFWPRWPFETILVAYFLEVTRQIDDGNPRVRFIALGRE